MCNVHNNNSTYYSGLAHNNNISKSCAWNLRFVHWRKYTSLWRM